jgi:GntR family transcriptional regulator
MTGISTIAPVKQRHRALYLAVRDELMRQIREGAFPPNSQLPPERELTQSLGVSRVILREALRVLEEGGVLIRRHGVGTFVNEPYKVLTSALEVDLGLTEIIEQNGATPGTSLLRCDQIDAPDAAKRLGLENARVVRIERVRTANGRPVAYTVDYVSPDDLGLDAMASLEQGSIYALLERHGRSVERGSARIIPVRAGNEISAVLGLSPDAVMLMIEQVDVDRDGRPLVYSREYHLRGAFEFTILRLRSLETAPHSEAVGSGADGPQAGEAEKRRPPAGLRSQRRIGEE